MHKGLLKILILLSLLFGPLSLMAQGEGADSDNDLEKIQRAKEKQAKAYKNIEDNLNAVEGESAQMLKALQESLSPKDMKELQEAMKSGDQEKVQKLTQKLSVNLLKDGKNLDKVIELSMKRFRDQSPTELRADLLKRGQGNPLGVVFKSFPKILDLTVNMLRDPFAIPQLAKIPQDKKRLLTFLGVNVLIFIISWIVKKAKKGQAPISRWLFFVGLRFGVLMFFFKTELTPAFLVFKRTFLG